MTLRPALLLIAILTRSDGANAHVAHNSNTGTSLESSLILVNSEAREIIDMGTRHTLTPALLVCCFHNTQTLVYNAALHSYHSFERSHSAILVGSSQFRALSYYSQDDLYDKGTVHWLTRKCP